MREEPQGIGELPIWQISSMHKCLPVMRGASISGFPDKTKQSFEAVWEEKL